MNFLNCANSGEIRVKDYSWEVFLQFTTTKIFSFSSPSFFVLSWCPGIHFKGSGFSKNNKEPETGKYTQVWQTHLHEQDRLFSSRHPK